jgi:hypothetical protein
MTATLPLIGRKRQRKCRTDAPLAFLAQFPLQQTSSIRAAWIAKERGEQVAQYESLHGYIGSALGRPAQATTAGKDNPVIYRSRTERACACSKTLCGACC